MYCKGSVFNIDVSSRLTCMCSACVVLTDLNGLNFYISNEVQINNKSIVMKNLASFLNLLNV